MTTVRHYHGKPLYSSRGLLLVGQPFIRPVVVVELYPKWYGLCVIHLDGTVVDHPFPEVPELSPCYVDHVPNPVAVQQWADSLGYDIDVLSYELMVGRWEVDVKDNY